jgi:hypothetical protein
VVVRAKAIDMKWVWYITISGVQLTLLGIVFYNGIYGSRDSFLFWTCVNIASTPFLRVAESSFKD